MTEAEMRLWQKLRAHRLQGLSFRRQAPVGPYIVDFLCAQHALIIELDGSGHAEPTQARYDELRDRWLVANRYHVFRLPNTDVLHNVTGVIDTILFHCGLMDGRVSELP